MVARRRVREANEQRPAITECAHECLVARQRTPLEHVPVPVG